MSAIDSLLREDLRGFEGYRSARSATVDGSTWLNANESPWPNLADAAGRLRRYPDPQPARLRDALARLYGVPDECVLVGRGSDEAIDLLVRAACRPGGDGVLVTPPVFGMYAVCARLHGAAVMEVPLQDGPDGFSLDVEAVAQAAQDPCVRLVFLCSPGNPAGGVVPTGAVLDLSRQLAGKAIVVVDEAYVEFAGVASLAALACRHPNLVVLRTLSKAHGLAGARIGCLVGHPELVRALRRCQAPYPIPASCVEDALGALSPRALAATADAVARVVEAREQLRQALSASPRLKQVYPSRANFLLVRCHDAQAVLDGLLAAGVVVRDMRGYPRLGDALRITVGTPVDNARVRAALDCGVAA